VHGKKTAPGAEIPCALRTNIRPLKGNEIYTLGGLPRPMMTGNLTGSRVETLLFLGFSDMTRHVLIAQRKLGSTHSVVHVFLRDILIVGVATFSSVSDGAVCRSVIVGHGGNV